MKKILAPLLIRVAILIAAVSLYSCGNPEPSNKVVRTDTEFSHWDKGVQVNKEVLTIEPTWGQAFHYAHESGYSSAFIWSIILFLVFSIFIVLLATGTIVAKGRSAIPMVIILAVLLVGSGYLFYDQPGYIRYNNQKKIDRAYFDKLNQQGKLRSFWDSVHVNNRMIGAAYKK